VYPKPPRLICSPLLSSSGLIADQSTKIMARVKPPVHWPSIQSSGPFFLPLVIRLGLCPGRRLYRVGLEGLGPSHWDGGMIGLQGVALSLYFHKVVCAEVAQSTGWLAPGEIHVFVGEAQGSA
jgi:hypothetical protein